MAVHRGCRQQPMSSSPDHRFGPGRFVVVLAVRSDAHPVTVATAVDVCCDVTASASEFVGVGCCALPPSPIDNRVVTGEDVTGMIDAGHGSVTRGSELGVERVTTRPLGDASGGGGVVALHRECCDHRVAEPL
jgi:hypothetical protein